MLNLSSYSIVNKTQRVGILNCSLYKNFFVFTQTNIHLNPIHVQIYRTTVTDTERGQHRIIEKLSPVLDVKNCSNPLRGDHCHFNGLGDLN